MAAPIVFKRPDSEAELDRHHTRLYDYLNEVGAKFRNTCPMDFDRMRLIAAEEFDNLFEHGSPQGSKPREVSVLVTIRDTGEVQIKIKHDETGFNSVNGTSPVPVVAGAVKRLGASYSVSESTTLGDSVKTTITVDQITLKK